LGTITARDRSRRDDRIRVMSIMVEENGRYGEDLRFADEMATGCAFTAATTTP